MKRKEDFPLTKHTLNLFLGDYEKLQRHYSVVGAARIIRLLVRAHLKKIEETAAQAVSTTPTLDVDIEESTV